MDAAKMEVEPDREIDAQTQAEIQKHMQEITLESAKYPEIAFRSSSVEQRADGQWKVEGMLTLHGATKLIIVTVKRNDGAYVSHVLIKQTDFGIKPVSIGGLVKVKNEVEIEFRIVPQSE